MKRTIATLLDDLSRLELTLPFRDSEEEMLTEVIETLFQVAGPSAKAKATVGEQVREILIGPEHAPRAAPGKLRFNELTLTGSDLSISLVPSPLSDRWSWTSPASDSADRAARARWRSAESSQTLVRWNRPTLFPSLLTVEVSAHHVSRTAIWTSLLETLDRARGAAPLLGAGSSISDGGFSREYRFDVLELCRAGTLFRTRLAGIGDFLVVPESLARAILADNLPEGFVGVARAGRLTALRAPRRTVHTHWTTPWERDWLVPRRARYLTRRPDSSRGEFQLPNEEILLTRRRRRELFGDAIRADTALLPTLAIQEQDCLTLGIDPEGMIEVPMSQRQRDRFQSLLASSRKPLSAESTPREIWRCYESAYLGGPDQASSPLMASDRGAEILALAKRLAKRLRFE